MGGYLSLTKKQEQEMLDIVGLQSIEELYAVLPRHLVLNNGPELPAGLSELETVRKMKMLSSENKVFPTIFRGAGAYRHYIPAVVGSVTSKETFLTAYTPYQAEISQGVLQSIFEYQTMICELTGMDVSNASVYDGATAAAEAVAMCRDRKRTKALVSESSHPDVIEVIRTYCWAQNVEVVVIPSCDGLTDQDALAVALEDKTVACVYMQQPNYYGQLEDAEAIGASAKMAGAKFIMGVNPIASALLKTPGECGADIAVGEGQPLGLPLGYGGPYLGFMACTAAMTRKLPGRIVGQTKDKEGRKAFVLTLQAREQHIRREKASSNICSNQALCAMAAAVYMAALGPAGLQQVAQQCTDKAHYLAAQLSRIDGFELVYPSDFFHEFVMSSAVEPAKLLARLAADGILGGLPVEEGILWCATEMNSKEEIDRLVKLVKEVCG